MYLSRILTPPYGILDFDDNIHYGSKELLQRVSEVSLRLHLFGYIHRQHGMTDKGVARFSNGAIMNVDYTDFRASNLIELQ